MLKMNWTKLITNKYIIATAAFIALLFFSDRNSVLDQYNKQQAEHAFYLEQIEKAKAERDELFTSDKNLEKFAREKYLMKKDDEDVFVFVAKDSIK
jgi:cell division protein FtsB